MICGRTVSVGMARAGAGTNVGARGDVVRGGAGAEGAELARAADRVRELGRVCEPLPEQRPQVRVLVGPGHRRGLADAGHDWAFTGRRGDRERERTSSGRQTEARNTAARTRRAARRGRQRGFLSLAVWRERVSIASDARFYHLVSLPWSSSVHRAGSGPTHDVSSIYHHLVKLMRP
jgi:hypothetical protein